MTTVFFLFLFHLSVGLLLALLLVPRRAGPGFFKLCSALAAFMTAAGLWLLYRRFGTAGGPAAPGGGVYAAVAWTAASSLALTVLLNRAWHLSWTRLQAPLLAGAAASGVAALLLASPNAIFAASDLSSTLLLGTATAAMILGHWYLVVLDLPIAALRRLTVALIAALALRGVVVGVALVGPVHAGYDEARLVASGLWSADGVFVWMRLLFGIAGPLSLVWFIWKTVEIRSTQSATGILYVQLFLVLAGELLAKYLRVAAGFPL
jgi:hypothetical protein